MNQKNELTIESKLPDILTLQVKDNGTLTEALTYLGEAKKELKALKGDMNRLIDPIKESIAGIKAKYEPRQTALESFIEVFTKKTTDYQTNLVNTTQQASQKIADKLTTGYIKPETAISKMEALPVIEKKIADTTFVEHKMCELEDINELPIEFHLADMVQIRKLNNAGIQVKGVKYWIEQRPRNR